MRKHVPMCVIEMHQLDASDKMKVRSMISCYLSGVSQAKVVVIIFTINLTK